MAHSKWEIPGPVEYISYTPQEKRKITLTVKKIKNELANGIEGKLSIEVKIKGTLEKKVILTILLLLGENWLYPNCECHDEKNIPYTIFTFENPGAY